jgi:carbon starvation protein
MKRTVSILGWSAVALLAAWAFAAMALHRGESVNAAWLLTAAICSYAVGYRFYCRMIARNIFKLDDARLTPAHRLSDGHDYVPTSKWVVFGHHFAAIAGPGPLVGPVLAAQFGFLPGTIWIIVGVVIGGAVQDFVILCASIRRDGKSLAQMAREEVGTAAGWLALLSIIGIIIVLIAFLSFVVVNIMADSPWASVTIGLTIPIAVLMGAWMRWVRPGRVLEASLMGLVLLAVALFAGKWAAEDPELAATFKFTAQQLGWAIIIYGFVAAALPIWLLLVPRDYLSAFMKVGTIALLALGICLVLPNMNMPAFNPLCFGDGAWANGTGKVVPGTMFPFCFITIACGAISGFHALVASGTTPKMIAKESHAPAIGYGGMLMESFVAVMAMIAACSLHPGIYFAMNAPELKGYAADLPRVAGTINSWINTMGFTITPQDLQGVATQMGESSIVGRTGGAPTLAVGMAQIFSQVFGGKAADIWYHFALMFEALFILTTIDAGTRVGRFLFQEIAGHIWKPLGRLTWWPSILFCSAVIVTGWGYLMLAAVADPKGGVQALLPLFGIANQLLAAVALCVATIIILKMGRRWSALVTAIPLAWLVTVTETAGWQKVFSKQPGIGFLTKPSPQFYDYLNTTLCAVFMTVIVLMVILSAYEAAMILAGKRRQTTTIHPPEPGPSEAELRES